MSQELSQDLIDFRKKICNYIETKVKNKKYIEDLEKAIFEATMEKTTLNDIKTSKYEVFKYLYNNRLSTVILNIKDIEKKLNNKEIIANDIFTKSPTVIFPDNWKESLKRKEEEEKFLYENHLVSNCKNICFKCKEQNVYSTHKQMRSADEPETIFYFCISCKNKWKT
jgi:DNA-directed RNA polymerase subunit M/transcription elongation factor TFIIS